MKKIFFTLLPLVFSLHLSIEAQQPFSPLAVPPQTKQASADKDQKKDEEGIVFFTPPAKWMLAESSALPPHVRVMVVGKGPTGFPPSMNLSAEPYKGTLKQYLQIVKNMNDAKGYQWKDLGTIPTQAGTASLSQVDTKTQWGDVRLMHVILVKNGHVYILTASALKDEFSIFYKEFFAAMRSLKIAKDEYEMVNPQQRPQLKKAANQLVTQWQTLLAQKHKENSQTPWSELQDQLFNSTEFQETLWNPFKQMLQQKYQQLGAEWQSLFLLKLEDQLFNSVNVQP